MASPPAGGAPTRQRTWLLVALATAAAVVSLWPTGYFLVGSSAGPALVRSALGSVDAHEQLSFERVQWGPDPTELSIFGVAVRNHAGRETMRARFGRVEVVLGSLEPRRFEVHDAVIAGRMPDTGISAHRLSGRIDRTLVVTMLSDLRAEGFAVELAWDAEGGFTLDDAFQLAPPRPRPKPPTPEPPKKPPLPKAWVAMDGIVLADGLVSLRWPDLELRFEDVGTRGRVGVRPWEGLRIDADLEGGASSVSWKHRGEPRSVRWEHVGIAGYEQVAERFASRRVTLTGSDGARIALAVEITPPAVTARGSVGLSPAQGRALTGRILPEGGQLTGLELTADEARLKGAIAEARAPRVQAGPTRVDAASARLTFDLMPSAVTQVTGTIGAEAVKAALITAPNGVDAEAVEVARVDVSIGLSSEARIAGARARDVRIAHGSLGAANATARVDVTPTGGTVTADVVTEKGTLKARSDISVNLLSQSVSVETEVSLDHVTGPLFEAIRENLPASVTSGLAWPLKGKTTWVTRGKLRDLARGRWKPEFTLQRAELSAPRWRAGFSDGQWTQPAASPDPGGRP